MNVGGALTPPNRLRGQVCWEDNCHGDSKQQTLRQPQGAHHRGSGVQAAGARREAQMGVDRADYQQILKNKEEYLSSVDI